MTVNVAGKVVNCKAGNLSSLTGRHEESSWRIVFLTV